MRALPNIAAGNLDELLGYDDENDERKTVRPERRLGPWFVLRSRPPHPRPSRRLGSARTR